MVLRASRIELCDKDKVGLGKYLANSFGLLGNGVALTSFSSQLVVAMHVALKSICAFALLVVHRFPSVSISVEMSEDFLVSVACFFAWKRVSIVSVERCFRHVLVFSRSTACKYLFLVQR